MPRWMVLAAAAAGCNGAEPHACDQGTPTCESLLTIKLPDPRTAFSIHVEDDLGMDLDVDCPQLDTGGVPFGDYVTRCGGGTLTVTTFRTLGASVKVQLEEGLPETFEPAYSKGGDFCGNECDQGTIQL
ncbi:MAG: hypothetical protein ABMA64_04435 [Myxococcota bacterium]